MEEDPTQVTAEQAKFIEKKTQAYFDYTIDCFDRARTEGNNILQWLFGAIGGGLPIIGGLWAAGYYPLAAGFASAVGAAAWAAMNLLRDLKSRETDPPGNFAQSIATILTEPMPRMRWLEAKGMDGRINKNIDAVGSMTKAVDRARTLFARLPIWFLGGTLIAYLAQFLARRHGMHLG